MRSAGNPPLSERIGQRCFRRVDVGATGRSDQGQDSRPIDRLSLGNFGDGKSLGNGLFELRIDWGPGYRVYYALAGKACVLLRLGLSS